jgi:hypothetical protein
MMAIVSIVAMESVVAITRSEMNISAATIRCRTNHSFLPSLSAVMETFVVVRLA